MSADPYIPGGWDGNKQNNRNATPNGGQTRGYIDPHVNFPPGTSPAEQEWFLIKQPVIRDTTKYGWSMLFNNPIQPPDALRKAWQGVDPSVQASNQQEEWKRANQRWNAQQENVKRSTPATPGPSAPTANGLAGDSGGGYYPNTETKEMLDRIRTNPTPRREDAYADDPELRERDRRPRTTEDFTAIPSGPGGIKYGLREDPRELHLGPDAITNYGAGTALRKNILHQEPGCHEVG